jgi:glyoxylase-like metal-dependent hydrolase (beta-lactamase superfamily II)
MSTSCFTIDNDFRFSRTYILYQDASPKVWLVDCGDDDKIKKWLVENNKELTGIFLTHCHIDHIYGVNKMTETFPDANVYVAKETGLRGVRDLRLNLTKFMEESYMVETNNLVEVDEGDELDIFPDTKLKVLKTDGHSPDSLSYLVDNMLFTGDAYIPGVRVITKLPGANKPQAQISLERIQKVVQDNSLEVMPGHYHNENALDNV